MVALSLGYCNGLLFCVLSLTCVSIGKEPYACGTFERHEKAMPGTQGPRFTEPPRPQTGRHDRIDYFSSRPLMFWSGFL